MTEILSMTMLSAEPVSAAKPQATQSNDTAAEPDQSFAATLAAEVNGKAPEKSTKALAKTRQNHASDIQEGKETSSELNTTAAELKQDKAVSSKGSASDETEELQSEASDTVKMKSDASEAEHSHWLNLLDKAKSLQERLDKTQRSETKTAALTEHDDLQTAKLSQQNEKLVSAGLPETEASSLSKVKSAEQKDGPVVLDKKLLSEQDSEQHLTSEELRALKLITQSDKTTKQLAEPALTQPGTAQNKETETTDKADPKPYIGVQKDTGPDQNKIQAHLEKPLKALGKTTQTIQPVEAEKPGAMNAEVLVATSTVSKSVAQPEQAAALLKASAAVTPGSNETVDSSDEKGSEILTAHAVATDPKTSVQAQSAAALLTPQVQQSKAPTAEAKVTTEELLKQLQTAGVTAQAEQGSSSSSGESSQHGSTEALLSTIEPQKTSAAVVAETNSFSSQLKSTLDKISSGISVSGRELVSEASQKQADQLGQKLNLIQPEASNQLKEKMLMMVKDKVHTAEIRLDPSELGSMQIKISLQQDQMSVQFMVQQGNAKELMEQQMPKLKELLQQQGIELSQGSVQQQNQSSSGQDGGRRTAGGTGSGNGQALSEELTEPVVLPTKTTDRVVDYYA
jgi:flagellar hook-length control protein FliK